MIAKQCKFCGVEVLSLLEICACGNDKFWDVKK